MNKTKPEKLDVLLAIYIAAIVAAELMGGKLFTIFGVNASVAIFIFPITFTINDIVIEVYGKERAMSFVRSGFVVLIMLALYILLAIALPPASRFKINSEYSAVFETSLRITLASLAAFGFSERFDVLVFSKIRKRFKNFGMWLRSNLSNFISMFFDTTIFMLFAFYKPGNFMFIVSLIWPYWLLKCLASVFGTPLSYWGVKWLRAKK